MCSLWVPYQFSDISVSLCFFVCAFSFPLSFTFRLSLPSSTTHLKVIFKNTNDLVTLLNLIFSKSQKEYPFLMLHCSLNSLSHLKQDNFMVIIFVYFKILLTKYNNNYN